MTWKVLDTCKVTTLPQHREGLFVTGCLTSALQHRMRWPPEAIFFHEHAASMNHVLKGAAFVPG